MSKYSSKETKLSQRLKAHDQQVVLTEEALPHRDGLCWLIVGSKGTGKTSLLKSALDTKDCDGGYRQYFSKIYIISPSMQNDKKMKRLVDEVEEEGQFFDKLDNENLREIVDMIDEYNEEHEGRHQLLILDDCIAMLPSASSKNALFNSLITNCRHKKLCIWITLQKLKKANTIIRTNTDMVSMFAATPGEKKDFLEEFGVPEDAFDYCTDKPYSFIHMTRTSGKPKLFCKFDPLEMHEVKESES